MRAFVITGPGMGDVCDVPAPVAAPGDVVVDVKRVGVCGTDIELFNGDMAYLHSGLSTYPLRPGHEWSGIVASVGEDVDPAWVGTRVTGDTMLGDQTCERCRHGRQHLCDNRQELGFHGRPGALAEQLAVPAWSLQVLPESVDAALGALVEPGGNALRAADAAQVSSGERALVLGAGTIGLLVAMFLRARGVEVHLLDCSATAADFARGLGLEHLWTQETLPHVPFQAVVDASTAPHLPALAAQLVEPGGRVVYVGLAGSPSYVDTRELALRDVTAVGILSASPALAATVAAFADGTVDPRPLVAAVVGLDDVSAVLAGNRPSGAGHGPKIHVDPRR